MVTDGIGQAVEPGAGVPVSTGEEPVRSRIELEARTDLMNLRVEEIEEGVVGVEQRSLAELGAEAESVGLAGQDFRTRCDVRSPVKFEAPSHAMTQLAAGAGLGLREFLLHRRRRTPAQDISGS